MDINTLEEKLGIANLSDAEKLALVKGIESNVQASKAAVKAQEAGQYASLVVDAIKRIKNDLETRFNELNGIIDVKAKTLQDGKDGLQGAKGEKGDRGFDGTNGKDGYNGKDGIDGVDGKDGVGVRDAYIDFDGSLIIKLTDGTEINVGEVVPMDVAEKIKVIGNGGGTSQSVLDSLASLQAQIDSISGGSSGLTYKGTWNASTNTPTLASSTGTNGWYYVVSVAGSTNLNGVTDWQVGDWAIYNGSTWQKLDQTNLVTSVAGRTGAVTLSNTDISGLGTMSTQAASNVAITGGAIDGATVGATTPAAGTFTALSTGTLTATGQTSLGGAAGSESLRVYTPSATGTWLSVRSTAAVSNIGTEGTSLPLVVNTNSGIFSVRSSSFGGVSAEQFRVSHTASAVNYVQVTGSATLTGAPTLSVQGSDANIPMRLMFKGNGGGSGGGIQLVNSSGWNGLSVQTVNNPNWINIAGVASGSAPVISALGSDTNIPLVLQPKGTGALQAQQTDSTATGGNARGINAVDWQTTRFTAANVASGAQSVVGGGYANSSVGTSCFVGGGYNNSVGGFAGVISGGQNNTIGSTTIYSAIVGGNGNTASGYFNIVGGGSANSGTSASAVTTQSATMNGTTAVTLSGSNANIKVGQYITGTYAAGTYVAAISGTSLTLSSAASGSGTATLSFFTPYGVVVGGGNNQATGSYSFIGGGGDAGTAANRNVASGDWSVVVGGKGNTASGIGAFIGGGGIGANNSVFVNTASGVSSVIGGGIGHTISGQYGSTLGGAFNSISGVGSSSIAGRYSTDRSITGISVLNSGYNSLTGLGTSQACVIILAKQTTDATATVLTSDGGAVGTLNQVILPNNSAYYFRGTVVAGVTGGGNTKGWTIEGVIKRGANAASTAIVGTATVTSSYADAGASTWALTATADTTNGGLAITFTGQAGTTIRTVAQITTTEMTF
jgi:hypothetical protein